MKFDEQMLKHLKPLAGLFLENEEYGCLNRVAPMLVGFSSGGWEKLGDDERERYLVQLKSDFHVKSMGDTKSCWGNADYDAIVTLVNAEFRGIIDKRIT